jgi:hypothetical protein
MPNDSHQRAAEFHDLGAHAHRAAAVHHGKEGHQTDCARTLCCGLEFRKAAIRRIEFNGDACGLNNKRKKASGNATRASVRRKWRSRASPSPQG